MRETISMQSEVIRGHQGSSEVIREQSVRRTVWIAESACEQ